MRKLEPLEVEVGKLLRSELGAQQELDISLPSLALEDLGSSTDLELRATISKIEQQMLRLSGNAELGVTLSCDRCLKEFLQESELQLDEIFSLEPETDQWPITRDGRLDLAEPLRQQVLLSLPTHPLCSTDCLGLCQICGRELRVCHHSANRDTLSPEVKLSKLKD